MEEYLDILEVEKTYSGLFETSARLLKMLLITEL